MSADERSSRNDTTTVSRLSAVRDDNRLSLSAGVDSVKIRFDELEKDSHRAVRFGRRKQAEILDRIDPEILAAC